MKNSAVYGDFIKFNKFDAPFVLEVAQSSDYAEDFARFRTDVLDNQIEEKPNGLTYESCSDGDKGPSAEAFELTMRYGEIPLINRTPMDPGSYNTFDSPYLNSPWDSGVIKLRFGVDQMLINVSDSRLPVRIEETIQPLALPYETDCNKPDMAWAPVNTALRD